MRGARILFVVMAAIAVASCMRQQMAYYSIDPATGRPVPVMTQQQFTQPQYGEQPYGDPQYAQTYQPQTDQAPAPQPVAQSGRGFFAGQGAGPTYVQQPVPQPPSVIQYTAPRNAAPQYAAPGYAGAPPGYAYAPPAYQPPYTLDSGDKLRIVVFGQDGISNSYMVDAGGNISMPLVGTVPARGITTQQLAKVIAERLKQGFVREPHVSVEVEAYRPFFILGEVTNPGQYPYVANMTAETAVAIAGGFAPRAYKKTVEVTRNAPDQQMHGDVPLSFPVRPGDTVLVKERWF